MSRLPFLALGNLLVIIFIVLSSSLAWADTVQLSWLPRLPESLCYARIVPYDWSLPLESKRPAILQRLPEGLKQPVYCELPVGAGTNRKTITVCVDLFGYQWEGKHWKLDEAGCLYAPKRVAVTASGVLYVLDSWHIHRRDLEGRWTIVGEHAARQEEARAGRFFPHAQHITVDPSDNLYVVGRGGIQRRDASGVWEVIDTEKLGRDPDELKYTEGLATDAVGNLYVSTSGGIWRRDRDGGWVQVSGGFGVEPGQFGGSSPSLACDAAGNLYALDVENRRVQKRSVRGEWTVVGSDLDVEPNLSGGCDALAVDVAGNLYTTDERRDAIRKRAPDGSWALLTEGNGKRVAQVTRPKGVALDETGHVYVADSGNNRVLRRDPEGVWMVLGSYDVTDTASTPGLNAAEARACQLRDRDIADLRTRLYVDLRGDGVLGPVDTWAPVSGGYSELVMSGPGQGEFTVTLPLAGVMRPATFACFHFHCWPPLYPKASLWLDFSCLACWTGRISLDGKSYPIHVVADNGKLPVGQGGAGSSLALIVDRDGNGCLNNRSVQSGEYFRFDKPFNVTGTTYVVKSLTSDGQLTFVRSAKSLPRSPLAPDRKTR